MDHFDSKLQTWLDGAQAIINREYGNRAPTLVKEVGKRYIRIVRFREDINADGQRVVTDRSAYAFIDTTTGDVLKPDGWKGPAKHSRGNIFDDKNGLGMVGPWGMGTFR